MRYEAIPKLGEDNVEEILSRSDLAALRSFALSVSLHSENPEQAEGICLRLAKHADAVTRGNAILGLGHLARLHRGLTGPAVRFAVEAALTDPDDWVRGQATSAADDLEQFLGWKIDRP